MDRWTISTECGRRKKKVCYRRIHAVADYSLKFQCNYCASKSHLKKEWSWYLKNPRFCLRYSICQFIWRAGQCEGSTMIANIQTPLAKTITSLLIVFLAVAVPFSATANPVSKLPGRWTGWGSVTHQGGAKEQLKCVATYFVENSGKAIRQNLRCASKGYKIDAIAKLKLNSTSVSGTWVERIHTESGSVSGRMTRKGFNLGIHGKDFSAAMSISTTKCKQSINIAPQGLSVTRISIGLAKC